VAEEAVVGDGPAEAHMVGAVVARIHRPQPTSVRVPGQRQFHQLPGRRAVQVSAHVIAGTHDVMDFFLHHVHDGTVRPLLMAALIIAAAALDHRKITLRWLVVIRGSFQRRLETRKGPRHTGARIGRRDLRVAPRALSRIHVRRRPGHRKQRGEKPTRALHRGQDYRIYRKRERRAEGPGAGG